MSEKPVSEAVIEAAVRDIESFRVATPEEIARAGLDSKGRPGAFAWLGGAVMTREGAVFTFSNVLLMPTPLRVQYDVWLRIRERVLTKARSLGIEEDVLASAKRQLHQQDAMDTPRPEVPPVLRRTPW